jgi:hypothetical protein
MSKPIICYSLEALTASSIVKNGKEIFSENNSVSFFFIEAHLTFFKNGNLFDHKRQYEIRRESVYFDRSKLTKGDNGPLLPFLFPSVWLHHSWQALLQVDNHCTLNYFYNTFYFLK